MTIAMLYDFNPLDVPGYDPSRLPTRHDISSYQQISIVAHFLLGRCIYIGEMGWYAAGKAPAVFSSPMRWVLADAFAGEREAVGVFLWATDSDIDKEVKDVGVNAVTDLSAISLPSLRSNETDFEIGGPGGRTTFVANS